MTPEEQLRKEANTHLLNVPWVSLDTALAAVRAERERLESKLESFITTGGDHVRGFKQ